MKRKRKKRRKEKKRSEEKKYRSDSISGPSVHRAKALPLDNVEHTRRILEFLLLKPSSLIKHEFKGIFQKNKTPKVVSVGCVGPWKHNGALSEFGFLNVML